MNPHFGCVKPRVTRILKPIVVWLAMATIAAAATLTEPPHPRLWFPKSAEPALREKLAKDPLAGALHAALLKEAEEILKKPTCRYDIPDGKRLLMQSRLALHNITHTAWAWRIEGDEKFRLRTIAELEAACAMKDWNPSHFLDIAEMATAVAAGYDWLYPTLTPEQRAMCERAIIDKALKPAHTAYEKGGAWIRPYNNWAQVCGGGIALAAAAVAELEPELAESLFQRGQALVEKCGAFYQPDGMYPEGAAYWEYGTNFHVLFLAGAESLGRLKAHDPILKKAGDAIMHLIGPTGMAFNFADGNAHAPSLSPAHSWLATTYQDPAQAQHVRNSIAKDLEKGKGRINTSRYGPLAILWLPAPIASEGLPRAAVFHGEQAVAMFRTAWTPDAAWLGIKGGTAAASHGHMDAGVFVYDAHNVRWIHDPGMENYNLPGYFGDKRWTYYRLQNRSHSTLEIGGKLQNPKAKPCPIRASTVTGDRFSVSIDLTDAYAGSAGQVIRNASFDARTGATRIEDEITDPVGEVVWRAILMAPAEIRGNDVILREKGKQVTLRNLSGAGAWTVAEMKPPTPEENQNKNFKALELRIPQAAKVAAIVEIQP